MEAPNGDSCDVHQALFPLDIPASRDWPGDRRDLRGRHSRPGRADEAAGRWLHQADQDAHRTDRLLRGGQRHLRRRRPEEGRPHRPEVGDLLRNPHHHRPGPRPGGRLQPGPGQRRQHPSQRTARRRRRPVYRAHPGDPRPRGIPHGPDPDLCVQRLRRERHPPGPAVLRAVRQRPEPGRRAGQRRGPPDQRIQPHRVPHHGHDRAPGTARRVRRGGLHHRPLRRRLAQPPGRAGAGVLRHLPGLRHGGAR